MFIHVISGIISGLLGVILVCSFIDKTRRVVIIGNIVCVAIVIMITLWALALARLI